MIALRFEDHARAGLAANGTARRQIGAMITRIDQAIAELSQKLGFHGSILGLTKVAAANPALVCDDHQLVTVLFQPSQRFARLREHLHLPRVAAVIDIAHERAVAVKKNGGPTFLEPAGAFEKTRGVALVRLQPVPALPPPARRAGLGSRAARPAVGRCQSP